jgi:triacylglycerol lipase
MTRVSTTALTPVAIASATTQANDSSSVPDTLRCDTRWPLLFVHGVGFRDDWRYRYWGRIPEQLTRRGACVYYGFQDAWGSFESNARALRVTLRDTLAQTGCAKINIIAHSKGGLDVRVLASMEDCAASIASITTIASPHAGSQIMDKLMRIPAPLFKVAAVPVNGFSRLLGDRNPDFHTVCSQLTTTSMRRFNNEHPVSDHIFCQSYAGVMSGPLTDFAMALPYLIVSHFEGPNDGLVATASTPYGAFGGVIACGTRYGLSHHDVVDRRKNTPEKRRWAKSRHAPASVGANADVGTDADTDTSAGEEREDCFSIVDWYLRLVADLKARGF